MRHLGMGRPKRNKAHRSTTIILGDGEGLPHGPVTTEDLYATPTRTADEDDSSSRYELITSTGIFL